MNIVHYSVVLLVAIIAVLVVIYRRRFNEGKKKHQEWVVVRHRGTYLPMTPQQKITIWDGMTEDQKTHHAKMVKRKVSNGSLVAVKTPDGVFYVDPDSSASKDYEHVWVGTFSDRIKQKIKK